MVITKLQGGLGNQMFQYAAARGISPDSPVYLDTRFLDNAVASSDQFTARSYELSVFSNLQARRPSDRLLRILENPGRRYRIARNILYPRLSRVVQQENEFVAELATATSPVILEGYFQSEIYFRSIREQLLQEFAFPELTGENRERQDHILHQPGAVSIHIRRGDYTKPSIQQYHGLMSLDYYRKAIEEMEAWIDNPFYFIFSDDPAWCRANLAAGRPDMKVMDSLPGSAAWEDLFLMTQCRHHIIANSSFSWWGAWLGTAPDAVNMAPANWFNPAVVKFDIHHIVPANWHIL